MRLRYFPTLLACIAIAFAILGGGLIIAASSWVWIPAAVLPLMYYHIVFLRRRITSGADTAAIDSVYYFGFLITVAALALSAISIARSSDPDFHSVLIKFGIGMIATGYALIARMDLQNLTISGSVESAESVMSVYVRRTQELIDNVETAIVRVNGFSQTVLDETRATQIRAQAQVDESLVQSARLFQKELENAIGSAKASIAALTGLIVEVRSGPERAQLTQLVKETGVAATELNRGMGMFSDQFESAAQAVLATKAAMDTLQSSFQEFTQTVAQIGAPDGHLSRTGTALLALTDTATKATDAAGNALRATSDFAARVTAQEQTFARLGEFAQSASHEFDNLAKSGTGLNRGLAELSHAVGGSEILARNVESVQTALGALSGRVDSLSAGVSDLNVALSKAALDLEANVNSSTQATVSLSRGLTDVARHIIDQTRRHQGVT